MSKTILTAFISILFLSCYQEQEVANFSVRGPRPIYLNTADLGPVTSQAPKEFGELGKIVTVSNQIYINELYVGIHVIDNSDPNNPVPTHFWSILGNIDFTIDGNFLYADNAIDLLTIDISDPANIVVLSTNENVYLNDDETVLFPPNNFGHFECVDPSKGIVIGWEDALLQNPKCSN